MPISFFLPILGPEIPAVGRLDLLDIAAGNLDVYKRQTELFTQGVFYKRGQNYYVTYEESETTGFEGCRMTLKVEGPDKVSMIRHGTSRSNLTIERGNRNIGFYNTIPVSYTHLSAIHRSWSSVSSYSNRSSNSFCHSVSSGKA